MSLRSSRRSGASSSSTLNSATIGFLDKSRLVKELSERGLPTNGNKAALADRLYEFVVNGTVPDQPEQQQSTSAAAKVAENEEAASTEKQQEKVEDVTPKRRQSKGAGRGKKAAEVVVEVKKEPEEEVEVEKKPAPKRKSTPRGRKPKVDAPVADKETSEETTKKSTDNVEFVPVNVKEEPTPPVVDKPSPKKKVLPTKKTVKEEVVERQEKEPEPTPPTVEPASETGNNDDDDEEEEIGLHMLAKPTGRSRRSAIKRERYSPETTIRHKKVVVEDEHLEDKDEDEHEEPHITDVHDADYEMTEREKERETRRNEKIKEIEETVVSVKAEEDEYSVHPKKSKLESKNERRPSLSQSHGSDSDIAVPVVKKSRVEGPTTSRNEPKPKPPPPTRVGLPEMWAKKLAELKQEKAAAKASSVVTPTSAEQKPNVAPAQKKVTIAVDAKEKKAATVGSVRTSSSDSNKAPPVKKSSNVAKTILDDYMSEDPKPKADFRSKKPAVSAPTKPSTGPDLLGSIMEVQEKRMKVESRYDDDRRRQVDANERKHVRVDDSIPPPPPRRARPSSPIPPPPPKPIQPPTSAMPPVTSAAQIAPRRRSRFDQPAPEYVQYYMQYQMTYGVPPAQWMFPGVPPPVPVAASGTPATGSSSSTPSSASGTPSQTVSKKPSPSQNSPSLSRLSPPPPPPPKLKPATSRLSPPPPPPPKFLQMKMTSPAVPPPPPRREFKPQMDIEQPTEVVKDWLPHDALSGLKPLPSSDASGDVGAKLRLESIKNAMFQKAAEEEAREEDERSNDVVENIPTQLSVKTEIEPIEQHSGGVQRMAAGRDRSPSQPPVAEVLPISIKSEPVEDNEEEGFVIREVVVDFDEGVTKSVESRTVEKGPVAKSQVVCVKQEPKEDEPTTSKQADVGMEDEEEPEYDPFENTHMTISSDFVDYVPSFLEGPAEDVEVGDEAEEEYVEEGGIEYDEEVGEENEDEEDFDEADGSGTSQRLTVITDEIGQETADKEMEDVNLKEPSDALDLLKRALPLLQSFETAGREKENEDIVEQTEQYCQISKNEGEFERSKDDQEKYFHGEPVPEDDDENLFEIAAGLAKPKKKEKKLVQIPEEEPLPSLEAIELDYFNADIHVKSAEKMVSRIEPYTNDGLALMWGGVRSNFGIRLPFKCEEDAKTKVGFQIRIDAYQPTMHLPTEFIDKGDVRVGFSFDTAPLVLGEYSGSWCISSTGKKASANVFTEFGHTFDIGDIVTAIFDLQTGTLSFLKNNESMGVAFNEISLDHDDILYAHICTKNANVDVNFGDMPKGLEGDDIEWNVPAERDWLFLSEWNRKTMVRSRLAPDSKSQCTVLMTVGLPGVGKTTWVRNYLSEHRDEHWTLISADQVMDSMRVNGVPRNRLPSLKRHDFLRGMIGKSMARLVTLAPRRRKNYMLDMTNCMLEKRKRKLMAFEEFNRKCVVFVPDENIHAKRLIMQEQEENEKLDTDALMQHKAAMSIPTTETDPCEEVLFVDPPPPFEHIAFERVMRMNTECRAWLLDHGNRRRGNNAMGINLPLLPPIPSMSHQTLNNASVLVPNPSSANITLPNMSMPPPMFDPSKAPPIFAAAPSATAPLTISTSNDSTSQAEESFLLSIRDAAKAAQVKQFAPPVKNRPQQQPMASPAATITRRESLNIVTNSPKLIDASLTRNSADSPRPETRIPVLGVTIPKTSSTTSATPSPITPRTPIGRPITPAIRTAPVVQPSPVTIQAPPQTYSVPPPVRLPATTSQYQHPPPDAGFSITTTTFPSSNGYPSPAQPSPIPQSESRIPVLGASAVLTPTNYNIPPPQLTSPSVVVHGQTYGYAQPPNGMYQPPPIGYMQPSPMGNMPQQWNQQPYGQPVQQSQPYPWGYMSQPPPRY